MRKYICLVCMFIIVISGIILTACDDHTPSTAVTYDELFREDYAKNMEAEHDKTREHPIDIPDGAETVTVDDEVYHVIRTIDDLKEKIYRYEFGNLDNYILGCDLDLKDYDSKNYQKFSFKGKFNGNNYKVYSTQKDGGLKSSLFYKIDNAQIENVLISSSDGEFAKDNDGNPYLSSLLINICFRSKVRNCVNYWQPKYIAKNVKHQNIAMGELIGTIVDTEVENCCNYGDLFVGAGGAIVGIADNSKIINCKNYGNITGEFNSVCGTAGIVGLAEKDCIIEFCDNYGKIGGTSRMGGIVGLSVLDTYEFDHLQEDNYAKGMVIKYCNNYGDVYLIKREDTEIFDKVSYEEFPNIFCVGGIAGTATKVENCRNEGNFYGFERLGKGIEVDYSGGIVGVALEIVNCESKYSIKVQKGRAKNVGYIYGKLL